MSEYGNYNPVHAEEYQKASIRKDSGNSMVWFALVALFAEAIFFAIYINKLETRIEYLERSQVVFDKNIQKLAKRPQTIIHRNEYVPSPVINSPTITTSIPKQRKKDCWIRDGNSFRECTQID